MCNLSLWILAIPIMARYIWKWMEYRGISWQLRLHYYVFWVVALYSVCFIYLLVAFAPTFFHVFFSIQGDPGSRGDRGRDGRDGERVCIVKLILMKWWEGFQFNRTQFYVSLGIDSIPFFLHPIIRRNLISFLTDLFLNEIYQLNRNMK